MADVKDWGAFIRGRWDWTRHGYEAGFPRGCQFTDLDAATEFDGYRLKIEAKSYDGIGILNKPDGGQLGLLRDEARNSIVFVVYGCGVCNDPYALHEIHSAPPDRFVDWRGLGKAERRKRLKAQIDHALGVNHDCRLCGAT